MATPALKYLLGTPEPAIERRLADLVALTWTGFAGRAACAANPVVTLLVDEDVAARL